MRASLASADGGPQGDSGNGERTRPSDARDQRTVTACRLFVSSAYHIVLSVTHPDPAARNNFTSASMQ